ncbi:MAG: ankyrin repeat domain-containing protein [Pseudomonadota bacterium]
MAKAKKKLLPKNFEELLKEGDIEQLKAVFNTHVVDARGSYSRKTALAFNECPDELARWLTGEGADILARDNYGETPLHTRAGHRQGRIEVLLELGADVSCKDKRGNTPLHSAASVHNVETVSLLLGHGAATDAVNDLNLTPLEYALTLCADIDIPDMAGMAEVLLERSQPPANKLQDMKKLVHRIGAEFEFHRAGFNPEFLDQTSTALDRLYSLFDVPPVARRMLHDGKSPIVAKATDWEGRHHELWNLLVPSRGAADTMQGEVIRVSGRIDDENLRNGYGNWDRDFSKMADAFLTYIAAGVPLSGDAQHEARIVISDVKRKCGDTSKLCELAVEWVTLNPKPLKFAGPN